MSIWLDGVRQDLRIVGGDGATAPAIRARIAGAGPSICSSAGAPTSVGPAALWAAWSAPREREIVGYKEGMTTLSRLSPAELTRVEFHHIEAFARGGPSTVENLTLRCNRHNRHAAERELGAARVAEAIARRRREHRADGEAAVLDE